MGDFMEFYDAALHEECDFLFFLDADTFVLNGDWAGSYFEAFEDPSVAAVSLVPRKGMPAIFALLCRVESYRALPAPRLACRYEFPENWPHGLNLQPGDFAARELARSGKVVVNVAADESMRHIVNFRGTTGIRAIREHMTRGCGEPAFLQSIAGNRAYVVAGHDNVLLGRLYEALYGEPFAPDAAGRPLGGSLTVADLRRALSGVCEGEQLEWLRARFEQSRRNISRMAAQEGVALSIPSVLASET